MTGIAIWVDEDKDEEEETELGEWLVESFVELDDMDNEVEIELGSSFESV